MGFHLLPIEQALGARAGTTEWVPFTHSYCLHPEHCPGPSPAAPAPGGGCCYPRALSGDRGGLVPAAASHLPPHHSGCPSAAQTSPGGQEHMRCQGNPSPSHGPGWRKPGDRKQQDPGLILPHLLLQHGAITPQVPAPASPPNNCLVHMKWQNQLPQDSSCWPRWPAQIPPPPCIQHAGGLEPNEPFYCIASTLQGKSSHCAHPADALWLQCQGQAPAPVCSAHWL